MGKKLKEWFRRLFFYSSRQLYRRRRTYLSVFVTSIVLMTVVMTWMEVREAQWYRQDEISAYGRYHVKIEAMLYDYSEEIAQDSAIREAWAIPWSSRLASSSDSSRPARISVENETTDEALNVTYIWGHAPGDGEIAVSDSLYSSVDWLEVGEQNDLWFTATQMTYYPLTVCGIFTVNDKEADYAFVSENTAAAIDAETGAVMKYDNFFLCGYNSDRYAAKTLDRLWGKLRLGETDFQQLSSFDKTSTMKLVQKYRQYINTLYLSRQVQYAATPVVIESLPIVAAAALILASFMTNWSAANAPELGILGAVGANRRDLCALAAGQILLISALSAPPVVLFSALLSNIYISAYNKAAVGIGFVFTVPWINLTKSALWFVLLSTVFTYFGIALLTRQAPFVLISGSWRGKMPFVKRSSRTLSRVKDKIARLALLETLRQIRGEILHAVICALLALVLGYYLCDAVANNLGAADNIRRIETNYPAGVDTVISVKNITDFFNRSVNSLNIPVSLADEIRQIDGVKSVGTYSSVNNFGSREEIGKDRFIYHCPFSDHTGEWEEVTVLITDEITLPYKWAALKEGNPDDLFSDPYAAVYMASPYYVTSVEVGTEFGLLPSMTYSHKTPVIPDDIPTFHVTAVAAPEYGRGDWIILSPAGAEAAGILSADKCQYLYVSYDEGLTEEEGRAVTDTLNRLPALLRYDIENIRFLTESEEGVNRANNLLSGLFFFMLFLSFCVMTYMQSSMKALRSRRDFAIERQLGATDREIYKKMRIGTYPSVVLALGITLAFAVIYSVSYIFSSMAELNIQADMFPLTYTPEFYAQCRAEIFESAGVPVLLFLASLPFQALSALAAVLGTVFPTRRLLKEPITEGLRKDTD